VEGLLILSAEVRCARTSATSSCSLYWGKGNYYFALLHALVIRACLSISECSASLREVNCLPALRLATRLRAMTSLPAAKTIGIVAVADLAARAASPAWQSRRPLADQIGRHCQKLIILAGRPAVFYDDALALDEACFAQASAPGQCGSKGAAPLKIAKTRMNAGKPCAEMPCSRPAGAERFVSSCCSEHLPSLPNKFRQAAHRRAGGRDQATLLLCLSAMDRPMAGGLKPMRGVRHG
jgi:hypothetical protein